MVYCVVAFILFGTKVLDKTQIRYRSTPSHSVYSYKHRPEQIIEAVCVETLALTIKSCQM